MNEYKYVITIAEEGGLTKASEKLYISSSALSQFVTKLEERLDVKLFNRAKSGWIPTPAGAAYIRHAYDIVKIERELMAEVNSLNEIEQKTLSIALSPGYAVRLLSTVLPSFKVKFPNTQLSITETTVPNVAEGVRNGQFDIGFLASSKDFEQIKLMDIDVDQIIVSVPADNLIAKKYWGNNSKFRPVMPISELKNMEFIVQTKGTTIRQMQDLFFEKAGFEPSIVVESTNIETSVALARAGYGVAILPARYAEDSNMAKAFALDTSLRWYRFMATRLNRNLTPAEEYILSEARKSAVDFI